MPTLEWIGKSSVINHQREVPFRLLQCDPSFSAGDPDSGNLLVQGDNLEALKALLPYYAGKVKCIYIDPPYNTGNENWVYNDNVNSPEIKAWLGKVVGGEMEDLSRHDKWLCMMYPRLALLREFLSEDGSIFISIDDNEDKNLCLIMDELFGVKNFVAKIAWFKRVSPANDAKYFSSDHEYLVVYSRTKDFWRPNRLPHTENQLKNYRNPDNDPRGPWNSATYTCNKSAEERPNLYYAIRNPNTGKDIWPRRTAVWKYDKERHLKNVQDNLLWWGQNGTAKMPRVKSFLAEARKVVPRSLWSYEDSGNTQEARSEILRIIENVDFITPKPVRLIEKVLRVASDQLSLILDSFSGSGSTGHAVLRMNKSDGGHRRFILVEMDHKICQEITAERLKRVIQGYGDQEPLGGGFRFCTLGEPLFDEKGAIRDSVKFSELSAHIFFTETGSPIPQEVLGQTPFIGVHGGKAVYLLFNGILGDKRPQCGNVLTREILALLPPHDGPKVIYGEACRLGENRLKQESITFKQIPYDVQVR